MPAPARPIIRIAGTVRYGYARTNESNRGAAVNRGKFILLGLALACQPLAASERPAHLLAADLYARGEYSDCRGLVNRLIDDYVAGNIEVPARDMAPVYLVAACLADVFRDTYWAEAVDDNLRIALEMDPNADASLAESRAYVNARYTAIRAGLTASQGPAGRRFSMGLVLVIDGPGSIRWRTTPSLGLRVGAGITPWLTIEGGGSIPLRGLPLGEGELYLGGTIHPTFGLNRPMVVLNASYVATHQAAWTHGLSFSVGAEIALRSGVSFRASTELLRLEGTGAPDPQPTDYLSFTLFGAPITLSFPRISLAVAYAF